jgi:predicted transcriptional regulator
VHVVKAQGITAERSGIMTGGWQTDREHIYTELTRAREETQIYVAREDLGEQGFDIGAMERLAERMQRSRAQEASITKRLAERITGRHHTPDHGPERTTEPQHPVQREPERERTGERVIDTPQQIDDVERRAELMRDQGADEATIAKQIAKEHSDPDAKWTRTNQEEQGAVREIGNIVEEMRRRRPDRNPQIEQAIQEERDRQQAWERGTDPDRGFEIE